MRTPLYGDVAKKTERLVRENAATYGLNRTTSVVEINEKTLKAIQEGESSDTSKVISLVKALVHAAQDKGSEEPYLIPISERAEAILEDFDDRQKSTRDALVELEQLAKEKIEAEKERRRTGMDINTFTTYWELKGEDVPEAEALAGAINEVIRRFPNFHFNPEELRQLKAEVYRQLLAVVDGKKMVSLAERLLKLNRK